MAPLERLMQKSVKSHNEMGERYYKTLVIETTEHRLKGSSRALKKRPQLNLPNYARSAIVILVALLTLSFSGCPDYSHLREAPDYKNMSDSGEVNK